jgi:hypothetical protein
MTDEEIIAAFAAFIARECDAPLSVTRKVIEEWIAKIKKDADESKFIQGYRESKKVSDQAMSKAPSREPSASSCSR